MSTRDPPTHHRGRHDAGRVDPLPPHTRIDRPPRIDEREVRGPHQRRQVEPHRAAGDQYAFERSQHRHRLRRPDDLSALDPRGQDAASDAKREKRNDRPHVPTPLNPPPLPPDDHQHCRRQDRDGRLAEKSEDEER